MFTIFKRTSTAKVPERISDYSFYLFSDVNIIIPPHCYRGIDTGLKLQNPRRDIALFDSLQARFGLNVLVINNFFAFGFEDNLLVTIVNNSDFPIKIRQGERIARILIPPIPC
jgi:dUTPase